MLRRIRSWLEDSFTSGQFTFKQISGMLVTLLMDSFCIMIINVLSVSMVSSVGEVAMAAANMVGTLNMMVSLTFQALATSGAIVVARAKGSNSETKLRSAVCQTISVCAVLAIVGSGLLITFRRPLIDLLYPRVEPLLAEYAARYLAEVCLSFPAYAMFCAIFNSFRSIGDTKSALLLTIIINGAHLVGSFVFINVLGLGIDGAGLSLIVARVIGVVVAFLWMFKVHNEYHMRIRDLFHVNRPMIGEIVRLGVPIASEQAILQGGMLLVQIYLAYLTTMEMAAHGVVSSIYNLFCSTVNAMISLAATVCGQCIGAKQYELARKYCLKIITAGRWLALVLTSVYVALMPVWFWLYSPSEAAQPIIVKSLIISAASLCIFGCDSNITPSALRAAGDAIYPSVVSTGALFLGRIALGYVLTIVVGMGVPGVWVALSCEMLVRAILLRRRVRGNAWLLKHQTQSA